MRTFADFARDVALVALLLVLLSTPAVYVLLIDQIKNTKNSLDEWLRSVRKARRYTNRHSPDAIAESRRERIRRESMEQIAYFAEWIQDHRNYLANAAPNF